MEGEREEGERVRGEERGERLDRGKMNDNEWSNTLFLVYCVICLVYSLSLFLPVRLVASMSADAALCAPPMRQRKNKHKDKQKTQ